MTAADERMTEWPTHDRAWTWRLRRGLGSAAVLVASLSLGPAPATAETLADALVSAYRTNPRIDAERARLRATDEEVARAMSGYRPTITGSLSASIENTNTLPDSAGEGRSRPKNLSLSAVQPLFRGFRTTNAVNEAEAAVRAGQQSLRGVEQSVLQEAVTAYMDVVRDQAIVRLRENNVTVLSRELRATDDRFTVGEVTRTDVAQARARRAGAVSALDLARANLKAGRARFERVVGHPPTRLVEPRVPERLVPKSLDDALAAAVQRNPSVVAALYREQGARFTVDRIWGELLPSAQLEARYSNTRDPGPGRELSETGSVTAQLTIPFYQGGEVHARVRQAKHTHVSRIQEIEQARTETRESVISAWSLLTASRAQLVSDQIQVDANQIALTGVREEERVGQRTLLDVLDAEQEFLNSQVQLAITKRDIVVNAYGVIAATGSLDGVELSLGETVYDPDAHYLDVRRKWWGIAITHRDGREERLDLWDHARDAPLK